MTNIRDDGNSSHAVVDKPVGNAEYSSAASDPLARLFALLPTADHLEAVSGGVALVTNDVTGLKAGHPAVTIDIPAALLNARSSLPAVVSIDDLRAGSGAYPTQGN
jgi:hypothetical protein